MLVLSIQMFTFPTAIINLVVFHSFLRYFLSSFFFLSSLMDRLFSPFFLTDNISLTDKLTSGGMPHQTAALVEACDPIQLDVPTIIEPAESPTIPDLHEHQRPDSDVKTTLQVQENGRIGGSFVGFKPPRPQNPQLHDQSRITKPIVS